MGEDEMILSGKPWRCQEGHILGVAVREGKVTRLYVTREAISSPAAFKVTRMYPSNVMAIMESGMVQCSICGRSRRWVPGEVALERLLGSIQRPVGRG